MRLFVAIELGEEMRSFLRDAQTRLAAFDRQVRWVRVEQMHLTLKFLGPVPDVRVGEVCQAARAALAGVDPFEMTLVGLGCFPPGGRVRVIWTGIEEPSGALARCQQQCEVEFERIGFPPEARGFTPHLTLGRVREDTSAGALRRTVLALAQPRVLQPVESIVVMESVLSPKGARYSPVARWALS